MVQYNVVLYGVGNLASIVAIVETHFCESNIHISIMHEISGQNIILILEWGFDHSIIVPEKEIIQHGTRNLITLGTFPWQVRLGKVSPNVC